MTNVTPIKRPDEADLMGDYSDAIEDFDTADSDTHVAACECHYCTGGRSNGLVLPKRVDARSEI